MFSLLLFASITFYCAYSQMPVRYKCYQTMTPTESQGKIGGWVKKDTSNSIEGLKLVLSNNPLLKDIDNLYVKDLWSKALFPAQYLYEVAYKNGPLGAANKCVMFDGKNVKISNALFKSEINPSNDVNYKQHGSVPKATITFSPATTAHTTRIPATKATVTFFPATTTQTFTRFSCKDTDISYDSLNNLGGWKRATIDKDAYNEFRANSLPAGVDKDHIFLSILSASNPVITDYFVKGSTNPPQRLFQVNKNDGLLGSPQYCFTSVNNKLQNIHPTYYKHELTPKNDVNYRKHFPVTTAHITSTPPKATITFFPGTTANDEVVSTTPRTSRIPSIRYNCADTDIPSKSLKMKIGWRKTDVTTDAYKAFKQMTVPTGTKNDFMFGLVLKASNPTITQYYIQGSTHPPRMLFQINLNNGFAGSPEYCFFASNNKLSNIHTTYYKHELTKSNDVNYREHFSVTTTRQPVTSGIPTLDVSTTKTTKSKKKKMKNKRIVKSIKYELHKIERLLRLIE